MKTYRDVGNDGQLKTCERSRLNMTLLPQILLNALLISKNGFKQT